MINIIKCSLFLSLLFLLVACNNKDFKQADVVYKITPVNAQADIDASIATLIKRMENYSSSFLSSIRYEKDKNGMYLVFKNGVPNEQVFTELAGQRGYLIANIKGSEDIVFDSNDITDAAAGFSNSFSHVSISITDTAGDRVGKYTEANIGGIMMITLDDEVILEAKVMQKLGQNFEISGVDSLGSNVDIANLIRHGALDTTFIVEKIVSIKKN